MENNDLTMFFQCPNNNKKKKRRRNPPLPMKSAQNPGGSVLHGKSATFSFPQELVEEILSRLPVKSLGRFSCVSKLWYHLIYSESFASLHIINYKTTHLLVGTFDIRHDQGCSMSLLPTLPILDGVYCDSDRVALQMMLELSPALFAGSFNGIVCLYAYHTEDIRLWNPVTKDVMVIPKSDIPRVFGRNYLLIVGLGFDHKTNDYKILQMVYGKNNNSTSEFVIQLELYSLRKNSWRKLDYSHEIYFVTSLGKADVICSLPFTEYKVICGLVRTSNRPTLYEIFLLDVSSEILDTISIPQSVEADIHHSWQVKVVTFRESVALAINHLGVVGENIFNIWVVNDLYSSECCSRSWSKLVSVEHNIGHVTSIIGIWENRIIYQTLMDRSIGLFDVGNRKDTKLISWLGVELSASIYKESIVQVSENNKEAKERD